MKRDRIIIFVLVGVMAFSAIAFSFPFLLQDDSSSAIDETSANEGAELINQAADLDERIPQDRFQPEGEVTELVVEDLTAGNGPAVEADDTITVHYSGWLASDGTVFDSSYLRDEPATFPLSGVIPGWTEGIPGMQPGGKRRLVIPAELAYGPSGSGSIPPNADLVFEVELIEIE